MSEQMSAREYAIKLSNGGICNNIGCPECRSERLRIEALILADRKATVERCREAIGRELARLDVPITAEQLRALDAVLEEDKHE
jgi:hypothetical protein